MLYHRHSLNEPVHRLLGVPFEDKDELSRVVRRFTVEEARALFRDFIGDGYGALFRLMPRLLYEPLSRRWGWHLLIEATK